MEELYIRECPECKKQIFYKSKYSKRNAEKYGSLCKSCNKKGSKNHFYGKHFIGKENPFFGKKHTKETKEALAKVDKSFTRKPEVIEKTKHLGKDNGMYGKSFYDVWLKKYGKEEADKRLSKISKKHSVNNSGEGNPMYGKPAPVGSGGGWSGWYKGWYFRSLRELSYMINVIEKNNYKWISLDNKNGKKYRVGYEEEGKKRTYRADFLIEDKWMVEIKPKETMLTPTNILKKEAAEKFCKNNGLEYRIVDAKIYEEQIKELFVNGQIKFIKRTLKYAKRRWSL